MLLMPAPPEPAAAAADVSGGTTTTAFVSSLSSSPPAPTIIGSSGTTMRHSVISEVSVTSIMDRFMPFTPMMYLPVSRATTELPFLSVVA